MTTTPFPQCNYRLIIVILHLLACRCHSSISSRRYLRNGNAHQSSSPLSFFVDGLVGDASKNELICGIVGCKLFHPHYTYRSISNCDVLNSFTKLLQLSALCFCHPGSNLDIAKGAKISRSKLVPKAAPKIPINLTDRNNIFPSQSNLPSRIRNNILFATDSEPQPFSSSQLNENTSYQPQNKNNNQRQLTHHHYHLTIILPAYNEINRIGSTLSTYMSGLEQMRVYQHCPSVHNKENFKTFGSVEFLVVDDGSSDGTADFVRGMSWIDSATTTKLDNSFWQVDRNVMCISLSQNEGKGAAIERGMLELSCATTLSGKSNSESSVRSIVLVADADGSGDISCINGMIERLEEVLSYPEITEKATKSLSHSTSFYPPPALVVGYREATIPKSRLRAILSWGFRAAVSSIFIGAKISIRDTQCGFKLMTASAGRMLYNQLHLRRWTHDVEVIHRARLLGVPVGESGVPWEDKDGSKLVESMGGAVKVSAIMLSEIARMRLQYALGRWGVGDLENK